MSAIDVTGTCSAQSEAALEPIFGTATNKIDAWLLIEHRGKWPPDIADADLPDATRAWLTKLADAHRNLRTQLIRRTDEADKLTVLLVKTGKQSSTTRFSIDDHAELSELGIASLLAGEDDHRGEPGPAAVYLVCTHGRRDRCCARLGVGLYNQMKKQPLDGELWQSSHQGGHRFAATMLYLPRGLHYGRLVAEDAEPLVASHARGELFDLRRYRGQTRLPQPLQTAEAWLREQVAMMRFGDVELLDFAINEGDRWTARFRTLDGMLHTLSVEPRVGEVMRKASCMAVAPTAPSYYYVVRHEAQIV